jgi:hypothetical protein
LNDVDDDGAIMQISGSKAEDKPRNQYSFPTNPFRCPEGNTYHSKWCNPYFHRRAYIQACQTQITLRAAHWVVKIEKLIAGRCLELYMTICVNFRHILANVVAKWTKISHIS